MDSNLHRYLSGSQTEIGNLTDPRESDTKWWFIYSDIVGTPGALLASPSWFKNGWTMYENVWKYMTMNRHEWMKSGDGSLTFWPRSHWWDAGAARAKGCRCSNQESPRCRWGSLCWMGAMSLFAVTWYSGLVYNVLQGKPSKMTLKYLKIYTI